MTTKANQKGSAMAGFRKAKAEQAAIKMGLYGPSGSGKTFTALLIAEGLAKLAKKRIAYVDTERGTDFYCQQVDERNAHPGAFDFDAMYTRSLTETIAGVRSLDASQYGVIVIDSVTHMWEAAINAYKGRQTKAGTIPMQAWGAIKKPYKELMSLLLGCPQHVLICGRQANEWGEDEESGELKRLGVKMRAEGETQYEPHILIRMEGVKPNGQGVVCVARAEKDRTGILTGKTFPNPTFETLCKPLMHLLGGTQASIKSDDETAMQDAEAITEAESAKAAESARLKRKLIAKLDSCDTKEELDAASKEITAEIKKQMLPADVAAVRERWLELSNQLSAGVF